MRDAIELRFCGTGGQGVLLMGSMLGAAAVQHGLWAAGSNSYGAQARGGNCRSEVVLARQPADYPHVVEADLLVAMSQGSYETYLPELHPQGLVIYDHPHVVPAPGDGRLHVAVPATTTAVEVLGSRQVANMVLVAATVSLTRLVPEAVLAASVEAGAPPRFRESNMKALEAGFAIGREARQSVADQLAPWATRVGLGV